MDNTGSEDAFQQLMGALENPPPPATPREMQVRSRIYNMPLDQLTEFVASLAQPELTELLYCLGAMERPRIEDPYPKDIVGLRELIAPQSFVCPTCGALNTERDYHNYFCRPGWHWFKKGDVRAYEERRALERGTSD